jgi:hypothetical protein
MTAEAVAKELSKLDIADVFARFSERQEVEKVLEQRLSQCMDKVSEICKVMCESPGSQPLTCSLKEHKIVVKADSRSLTFTASIGAASDARLQRPRGMLCCQVLIFGHIEGQDQGKLVDTFRVYADGICSDGETTWKVEGDYPGFVRYLVNLLKLHILDCDLYWPAFEELPGYVHNVSVKDDDVDTESVRRPCVGFECNFADRDGSNKQ